MINNFQWYPCEVEIQRDKKAYNTHLTKENIGGSWAHSLKKYYYLKFSKNLNFQGMGPSSPSIHFGWVPDLCFFVPLDLNFT